MVKLGIAQMLKNPQKVLVLIMRFLKTQGIVDEMSCSS